MPSIRPALSRRQFLNALFLTTATGALSACANGGASSSGSTGAAGSASSIPGFDGTFIVGFDEDFPPYGYKGDDGEYTGFDLDLAQKVCEREHWIYTPMPISWDAKDALLGSGQITCIWNGFTIEGREDKYYFVDPYMENKQVVVVLAGSGITALSDLSGKNVITQTDSAAYDLLKTDGAQAELGASFAQLKTIGDYNTAFMMLESGSVDAIACDYPVAAFNGTGKEGTFSILSEALNTEHFGVGFDKTDTGKALAAQVEKDLQALDADGTVKELCAKYASQGVSYDLWCLPKAN
ncbi:transporter substrate-binding domain-containing protein [Olsenella sp. HMSC062G07]|uniref:transporter substrate-binding domain-containing protein n=1 Tax=Olsenella sp. HMSC062G07 TaxID=1739330 RepID=UPI0008A487D7|nr:transporter substrate-binding domain-containing protein [Olsenella sp. HMSC062G07]OFK24823.1 ABC transporter substrate-binding protein [Olsenella sp. HMSC062G07]